MVGADEAEEEVAQESCSHAVISTGQFYYWRVDHIPVWLMLEYSNLELRRLQ